MADGPTFLGDAAAARHLLEVFSTATGQLYAVADRDGIITYLAGPVRWLLGVEAADLVGTSVYGLVRPADMDRARERWAQRLSTTEPMAREDFWTESADGRRLCLNIVTDNRLADPAIAGVVVVATDVTEVRRLEQAATALAAASAAVTGAATEVDLASEICSLVCADERYELAWIGVADGLFPLGVRLLGSADGSARYLEEIERLAAETGERDPVVAALDRADTAVIPDIATSDTPPAWRQLHARHGVGSVISVRLGGSLGPHGILAVYAHQPASLDERAVRVLRQLGTHAGTGLAGLRARAEGLEYVARLEAGLAGAVRALALAAELRDPYTADHQRRTGELANAIATEMALEPALAQAVSIAAAIHDVGNLVVPSEILSRTGELRPSEHALIRQHPVAGHEIAAEIDFPGPVRAAILQHHERLDGSGYPAGLRGAEISVVAQVVAAADVVEAMLSHRPYRPALSRESCLAELRAARGTTLDPEVVDACIRLLRDRAFAFSV